MRYRRSAPLLCLGVLLIIGVSFAQSDLGSMVGFVKDPSGGTVPRAAVTIKNEATGAERRTATNDAGFYVVTNVPPGLYSVSVEAPGFKNFEVTHNKLDSNATATVDAMMAIGAPTETVEVSAAATTLQSESAAIQGLVTSEQIDMLELNGRNPIGLAGLVPGARGNAPTPDLRGRWEASRSRRYRNVRTSRPSQGAYQAWSCLPQRYP